MFDKILARLKEKCKNKGLSDKVLTAMATRLAKTITEESAIEGAVEEEMDTISAFQSETDSRVNTAVAKAKAEKTEPKADDPKPADPAKPDDAPAWAKGFLEQQAKLAEEINTLKAGKTIETRKAQLETSLKDASTTFKDLTLKSFGRMNFKDDAEFTAYLDEVKTDATAFGQTEANGKLGGMGAPGKPGGVDNKAATKEELAGVVSLIV